MLCDLAKLHSQNEGQPLRLLSLVMIMHFVDVENMKYAKEKLYVNDLSIHIEFSCFFVYLLVIRSDLKEI